MPCSQVVRTDLAELYHMDIKVGCVQHRQYSTVQYRALQRSGVQRPAMAWPAVAHSKQETHHHTLHLTSLTTSGSILVMPLQKAPYAYTPFCDNNKEMDEFRFWKGGFWASHLMVGVVRGGSGAEPSEGLAYSLWRRLLGTLLMATPY